MRDYYRWELTKNLRDMREYVRKGQCASALDAVANGLYWGSGLSSDLTPQTIHRMVLSVDACYRRKYGRKG